MGKTYYISHESLHEFIRELYMKAGMSEEDAVYHAEGLIHASLRGVDSHGVMRISSYLHRMEIGAINIHPNIQTVKTENALHILDADSSSGFISSRVAMEQAIELARQYTIGTVLVRNSNHNGAGAFYGQMAIDAGMIGFCTTNVCPNMAAPGAMGDVVGNNPFCIAVPTYCEFPFMLDMALSVVAGGKLKMAAAKGEKIPFGWASDRQGNPTDDPQKGFDGFLLPVGGFKGLGMAYAVDLLCGMMSGGAFQTHLRNTLKNPDDPSHTCHMFMAIDAGKLIGEDVLREQMQEYRAYIQSIPTTSGESLVFPGEIEHNCMIKRLEQGIPVPESLFLEYDRLIETYELTVRLNVKEIEE